MSRNFAEMVTKSDKMQDDLYWHNVFNHQCESLDKIVMDFQWKISMLDGIVKQNGGTWENANPILKGEIIMIHDTLKSLCKLHEIEVE